MLLLCLCLELESSVQCYQHSHLRTTQVVCRHAGHLWSGFGCNLLIYCIMYMPEADVIQDSQMEPLRGMI